MAIKRQLLIDIELINTLKLITQAYQEISVMRMKEMKIWVLAARQFLDALSEVFYDVRSSYNKQITAVLAKKKKQRDLVRSQEAKELTVLISASSKLYGDIVDKVFRNFLASLNKADTDILIIGKLGKRLFDEVNLKRKYLYFEIPESEVTVDDLKPIIFNLVKYNKINVYYGRYDSVITQHAEVSNITGDEPFKLAPDSSSKSANQSNVRFIFEPNLEKILEFFQTQVFSALFKQTVHEAHLAHLASRVKAMEEAINNIEATRIKLDMEKRRMVRTLENRKILERISGISLWSTH